MKPMVHQWVGLESPHYFSWKENGETLYGNFGRRIYEYSDRDGIRMANVAAGKLRISVYSSEWQTEKTFEVLPDSDNTFSIHRPIDEARELRGSLTPAENVAGSITNAEIKLGSIDGETAEKLELTSDEHGNFLCKSMSSKIGAFAFTSDDKFAGFGIVSDFSRTFEITMQPTVDYHGMLIDIHSDPIANHPVEVSINVVDDSTAVTATWAFEAKKISAMTDSGGRYTLRNLPCKMPLDILTSSLDQPDDMSEFLNRVSLQTNEDRPMAINRLKSTAEKMVLKPLAARFTERLRDSRLGGFRTLAIVSNDTEQETQNFIDEHFVSNSRMKEVMSYMPFAVRMNDAPTDADIQFALQMGWP